MSYTDCPTAAGSDPAAVTWMDTGAETVFDALFVVTDDTVEDESKDVREDSAPDNPDDPFWPSEPE